MIKIEVPGSNNIEINNIVLDFNGTIACDGELISRTAEKINDLAQKTNVYLLTADTYGNAGKACKDLNLQFLTLSKKIGALEKEELVIDLNHYKTAAIGNGANDSQMLKRSALGITVIESEGAAVEALLSADIAVKSINDALDLLLNPKRIKATLRK